MNDSVVAIVSAFFVIGITVGVITVVAMSALRTDRQGRRGRQGRPLEYGADAFDELPPDPSWDDADPDDYPRWPANADHHFRNG